MATKQICDVKSCEVIIKDERHAITLGDKVYDLCTKCYQGFLRFVNENLNEGSTKPISIISDAPWNPFAAGQPVYIPNIYTPNIAPALPGFGTTTWSYTADTIATTKNEK